MAYPFPGLALHSFADVLALPEVSPSAGLAAMRATPAAGAAKPVRPAAADAPLLLVSHDFKGNYRTSDAATYAASAAPPSAAQLCAADECFTMEGGWPACDVFNYFSHARVSVPPAEWIAAARKQQHGCRVIGTVLTEWDGGARDCAWLLEGDRRIVQVALRLATLCVERHFDGYLVNIENPVADEPRMLRFVQLLRESVRGLLGAERGLVLWYDSVVASGALRWQNTLNRSNSCFFERSDGIFTNYHWSDNLAADALETVAALNAAAAAPATTTAGGASLAQRRTFSATAVYMGTDVFGRGTFLGGGHKSHEAVAVALSMGASAALFAPGWTMETFDHAKLGAADGPSGAPANGSPDDAASGALTTWQATRRSFVAVSGSFWRDVARAIVANNPARGARLASWAMRRSAAVAAPRSNAVQLVGPASAVTDAAAPEGNSAPPVVRVAASSFCGSAGAVFAVLGAAQLTQWCQHSAVDRQLPCEQTRAVTATAAVAAGAASSIAVVEAVTLGGSAAEGVFWGNRCLRCQFSGLGADRGVTICALHVDDELTASDATPTPTSAAFSIVLEIVVPTRTAAHLRALGIGLAMCVDAASLATAPAEFVQEASASSVLAHHVVLRAVAVGPRVSRSAESPTAVRVMLIAATSRPDASAPPAAVTTVVAIVGVVDIGYVRVAECSAVSALAPLVQLRDGGGVDAALDAARSVTVVPRAATQGPNARPAALLISASDALRARAAASPGIESIGVVLLPPAGASAPLDAARFCGYVYVAGVFLCSEVPPPDEPASGQAGQPAALRWQLVERHFDGSFVVVA
jgi:hypothetical protein